MIGQFVARPGAAVALALSLVVIDLRAQARFVSHSDLAVLHIAVTDDGGYVSGLERDAFAVFEDGVRQPIAAFNNDDVPATIGLLIDDSASMQGLRSQVAAAVGTFVATSHPDDEIFALTFNERVQPVLPSSMLFTNNPDVLRLHLQNAITARGRTALYDAVDRGISYLADGTRPRKALVVVSDGGDNASLHSSSDMQEALAASNTVVYAVILRDPTDREANPRLLKRLAKSTGGLSFAPRDGGDIAAALTMIAKDIRSTYTVGYAVPPGEPGLRHVRVIIRRDGRTLHARTRSEYLAR
jgi:Ca-activated chloride channel homolog